MMKARYIYKAKFKILLMQLNDATTFQLKAENSAVEWCKQGSHKAKSIIYSKDDVSEASCGISTFLQHRQQSINLSNNHFLDVT